MHDAISSQTAFRVAMRRAVHQILDSPRVFDDPLALPILGEDAASKIASFASGSPQFGSLSLRAALVARSRYAEDKLAKAVESGTRQYVVLGAGLDTFAYRNPHQQERLRVFEVDHPATQEWKRDRLRAAGIPIPANVVFVPVDFERQTFASPLEEAGFRIDQRAFFSCLGVVPYLTERAFEETLGFIAAMPEGSEVVLDYAVARSCLNPAERLALDALAARVASGGEPFLLYFEPRRIAERLRRMKFRRWEDLGSEEVNSRYFAGRTDGLRMRGNLGHLLSAQL